MSEAKLEDADLSGANLVGADLSSAHLRGADMRGALAGRCAKFANADVSGNAKVNLAVANLPRDVQVTRCGITPYG